MLWCEVLHQSQQHGLFLSRGVEFELLVDDVDGILLRDLLGHHKVGLVQEFGRFSRPFQTFTHFYFCD